MTLREIAETAEQISRCSPIGQPISTSESLEIFEFLRSLRFSHRFWMRLQPVEIQDRESKSVNSSKWLVNHFHMLVLTEMLLRQLLAQLSATLAGSSAKSQQQMFSSFIKRHRSLTETVYCRLKSLENDSLMVRADRFRRRMDMWSDALLARQHLFVEWSCFAVDIDRYHDFRKEQISCSGEDVLIRQNLEMVGLSRSIPDEHVLEFTSARIVDEWVGFACELIFLQTAANRNLPDHENQRMIQLIRSSMSIF